MHAASRPAPTAPLPRRGLLRLIAGTGLVTLAAGGAALGAFAATRTPDAALAPWREAGATGPQDPRLAALGWAILAPNPHNRQPWLFRLTGADGIEVTCDLARRLPETDPFDRQITIGFGCLLELLRMAAADAGLRAEVTPFPEGAPAGRERLDARPVARVRMVPDAPVARDPLFAHVPNRRTCKEPFSADRLVDATSLAALPTLATPTQRCATTSDPALVGLLRDLTFRAFERECRTPPKHLESVGLMRIGRDEIEAAPDGIDIGGAFPELMALAGALDRGQLANPASDAFDQTLDMYREILGSAAAYVWLSSDGDGKAAALEAGRDWVRLNLAATSLGLSFHPVSQALQEYEEMADLAAELRTALSLQPGRVPQMLARLGYGPTVPPSPRWRLATRLQG